MASGHRKLNFIVPIEVADRLWAVVAERRRSAFVAEALRERLDRLEREQVEHTLVEGYMVRREEDSQVKNEWERATLDAWPA